MAHSPKRGGSEKDMEEESDPMFVIKNLDTGLQMRIDDFAKIANLATDERQEQEHPQRKGVLKFKGGKAIKTWTTETTKKASAAAKKAVSGIKDVAQEIKHELKHELNAANMLTKHKSSRSIEPSPSKASSLSGSQLPVTDTSDELLRRSTTAENLDSDGGYSAGSLTSMAASDHSAVAGQGSKLQQQQPVQAAAAGSADSASTVVAAAVHVGGPLGPVVATTSTVPLASDQHLAVTFATAAAAAATVAASTAAAAAVAPGPAIPTAVRLVSHKRSSNTVHEVVLAQVLEGSCGVVWAVGFSRDGSFLATAGQDGVLRIWQTTASR
eukprot:GHUV01033379.1.p1 GENE.GHUV01033379.1~~GHUV01033379.1.p1  ORF type:complete len:326 (+),score=143.24 GHUV01033379.1:242-1219(+)